MPVALCWNHVLARIVNAKELQLPAIMHFFLSYYALVTSTLALWPQPKHFEHGSSTLWLSSNVQLVHTSPITSPQPFEWLWNTVQKLNL